ncbi:hypothetical protein NHH03_20690 [Stieleria sp. TO1_6]|uniref:hypothetical protein n=1 Tax=Stieleria tagensis TaxID=2956795 RepID=UPI00209B1632|nr:hypothetical protein [Stieleria tagensis]MCO8124174.1 hypothetical protein [Stieleria tagensis]
MSILNQSLKAKLGHELQHVVQDLHSISRPESKITETVDGAESTPPPVPPMDFEATRRRVETAINQLEMKFDLSLRDTRLLQALRWIVLAAFVLILVFGLVKLVSGEDSTDEIIGVLSAVGGAGGVGGWLLMELRNTRKQDIGLALTVARYRGKLAACESVSCVQTVAAEIADAIEALSSPAS